MTDAAEAARALAARRPTTTIICAWCGQPATVTVQRGRNAPRTCSTSHRQMLWARERRERERAAAPKP